MPAAASFRLSSQNSHVDEVFRARQVVAFPISDCDSYRTEKSFRTSPALDEGMADPGWTVRQFAGRLD